jgi:hypothetical protein
MLVEGSGQSVQPGQVGPSSSPAGLTRKPKKSACGAGLPGRLRLLTITAWAGEGQRQCLAKWRGSTCDEVTPDYGPLDVAATAGAKQSGRTRCGPQGLGTRIAYFLSSYLGLCRFVWRRRRPTCGAAQTWPPRPAALRALKALSRAGEARRSPAKRTLYCARNASKLNGLGLVAVFRGQPSSPSGGEDFHALGGGVRGGGARRARHRHRLRSTRNETNPVFGA